MSTAPVPPLSVCARHTPPELLNPPGDGRLHVTARRLAELRTESARHIGQCLRGPIIAIPVAIVD